MSHSSTIASQQIVSRSRGTIRVPWQVWFLVPALLFLALASLYPLVKLVQMSVSDVRPQTITTGWPVVGFKHFMTIVGDPQFRQALVNTLVYTVLVVVAALGGGLAIALALNRGGPLAKVSLTVMLIVWLVPPIASGLMWKFLLTSDGVVNSLLQQIGLIKQPIGFLTAGWLPLVSVALVNAWVIIPFATIVFRSSLLDVPKELREQSTIDGAGAAQTVMHVVLPLLLPAILTLACLTVVYAFKSFDFIYVMTGGGPGTSSSTLPFLSWKLSFSAYDYGRGAAVAVLAMLIVSVFSIAYVRLVSKEISS
jgi:multiple sugar transport system permease protein